MQLGLISLESKMRFASLIIATLFLFCFCTPTKLFFSAKKENYDAPDSVVIGLKIGQRAPELVLKNVNDSLIPLSSLKGYYVLVDFWASWCGPCRLENPNVVKHYQQFKSAKFKFGKGYRVYNISLDMNKDAWKKAIEKDQLNWPYHVSDLKGWNSEAAAKYAVNSIPMNWLIDPRGIIIAKGLRGPSMEKELSRLVENSSGN